MAGDLLGPVEQVLARAGSWEPEPVEQVDHLELDAVAARRPFGRFRSRGGREVLLALARGTTLEEGDLLWRG